MNITIAVPPGSETHGVAGLICLPPKWHDYLLFLAANYFAHAITVVSFPGQTLWETISAATAALLLPMSGIARALEAIGSRAIFYRDPIKRAARAGALCMVSKAQSDNLSNSQWHQCPAFQANCLDLAEVKIQGIYHLEAGWHLYQVPRSAPVSVLEGFEDYRGFLSTPYSVPKLLVGLVQAIWASVTLYQTRGTQIDNYGFAAFGLTVAQYAYMSILNVVGNLILPEYPAMFMIRTPHMDEAERDGCFFSGELRVKLGLASRIKEALASYRHGQMVFMPNFVLALVPLAIVGILSKFQPQGSTKLQRVFTMYWLGVSTLLGPFITRRLSRGRAVWVSSTLYRIVYLAIPICFGCSAFVGGIAVVMQMLREYGVCIVIG